MWQRVPGFAAFLQKLSQTQMRFVMIGRKLKYGLELLLGLRRVVMRGERDGVSEMGFGKHWRGAQGSAKIELGFSKVAVTRQQIRQIELIRSRFRPQPHRFTPGLFGGLYLIQLKEPRAQSVVQVSGGWFKRERRLQQFHSFACASLLRQQVGDGFEDGGFLRRQLLRAV